MTHVFKTGDWFNQNKILNYISLHKNETNWKKLFQGTAIERKIHRIFNGTYIPPRSTTLSERVSFLYRAIRSPLTVGSLMPSSRYLAKAMVRHINKFPLQSDAKKRNILEVGPGSGSFTDRIIKRMGKHDVLYLVEFDKDFVKDLGKKYRDLIQNKKIVLIKGDILQQSFPVKFDHIISGLPLNSLGPDFTKNVFQKFKEFSKTDNTTRLSYFEYKLFVPTKIHSKLEETYQLKKDFFKENRGEIDEVWRNITPALVKHHQIQVSPLVAS